MSANELAATSARVTEVVRSTCGSGTSPTASTTWITSGSLGGSRLRIAASSLVARACEKSTIRRAASQLPAQPGSQVVEATFGHESGGVSPPALPVGLAYTS